MADDGAIHLGLLDDEAITLDTGALQLAALDHPGVDIAPYVALLSRMTERIADLGEEARDAAAQAALLAKVIADEFGLTGDRDTYDDPANADLIRVLDRRRGLPVSLSILYVAAARRLGWPADALNTPGHVLIRIGSDLAPVLADPFAGGTVVDADALARLLARVLGTGRPPTSDALAPMSNRQVLVRLLMNQATRAEARGDGRRAGTLFRRMTELAPGHVHLWWERARLELAAGDVPAARASLGAMFEMTRDPAQRGHIAAALDHLGGRGHPA